MSIARLRLLVCCLLPGVVLTGLTRERSDPHDRPANAIGPRVAVAPMPRPAPKEHPLPVGAVRRFGTTWLEAHGTVTELTFAAGDAWLVGCEDGGIRIWDVRTGGVVRRFGDGDPTAYRSPHILPDNRILSVVASRWLTTNEPGPLQAAVTIRRYDTLTGLELARIPIEGLERGPSCSAYSPDGTALYVVGDRPPLLKFDTLTGRRLWSYQPNPATLPRGVVVSPDGRTVALTTHGPDAGLRMLNAKTGEMLFAVPGQEGGPGTPAFSPDSQSIAVGTTVDGKGVAVWGLYPLRVRRLFDINSSVHFRPYYTPDGKTVALWGWQTSPEPEPPKTTAELQMRAVARHMPQSFSILHFDPATGTLRSANLSGALWSWAVASSIPPPVAFSPNGRLMAVGNQPGAISGDGIRLYDTRNGSDLAPYSLSDHLDEIRVPNFLYDDRQLNVTETNGGEIITRDLVTDQVSREKKSDDKTRRLLEKILDLTVHSADGRLKIDRLEASFQKPHVYSVRDSATDREVARVSTTDEHESLLGFGTNSKQLLICADDFFRVYDVATGKLQPGLGFGPLSPNALRPWGGLSSDGRYVHCRCRQNEPIGGSDLVGNATILETTTWQRVRLLPSDAGKRFHWENNGRFTLRTEESQYPWAPTTQHVEEWGVVFGCLSSRQVRLPERACTTMSRNGRMLAAWWNQKEGAGYTIRIYESETGRERHRFVCYEPFKWVALSSRGRFLFSRHPSIPHILWDLRGDLTDPQPRPDAAGLTRAWTALTSDDAPTAFQAVRLLAQYPDISLPLLRAKISPVAPPDPAAVGRFLADLDADDFLKRERAGKELEKIGRTVIPALQTAARDATSAEVARRAQDLVTRIGHQPPGGPDPVLTRALEVVEWADTPDAVKLLEYWATGAGGARLTEEAKAALARLVAK
ncbi:WD40 repeat domain-containing protein [Fimbriiglobus ruber]|nr:WD40 repeat domain-containing protein [Fimbriiglobus ruber]